MSSPVAKITATLPNVIATKVTTVRSGRANGAARPSATGRGTHRSLPSSRCASHPCRPLGAAPTAMARAADRRPARSAGTSAATIGGAATNTHAGAGSPLTP
jgi:hypothetical protein